MPAVRPGDFLCESTRVNGSQRERLRPAAYDCPLPTAASPYAVANTPLPHSFPHPLLSGLPSSRAFRTVSTPPRFTPPLPSLLLPPTSYFISPASLLSFLPATLSTPTLPCPLLPSSLTLLHIPLSQTPHFSSPTKNSTLIHPSSTFPLPLRLPPSPPLAVFDAPLSPNPSITRTPPLSPPLPSLSLTPPPPLTLPYPPLSSPSPSFQNPFFPVFRWFGQMRDVQQFPDKQAFDSCDFSRADPVGPRRFLDSPHSSSPCSVSLPPPPSLPPPLPSPLPLYLPPLPHFTRPPANPGFHSPLPAAPRHPPFPPPLPTPNPSSPSSFPLPSPLPRGPPTPPRSPRHALQAGGADVITVVSAGEGAEEEEDESLQRLRALRQVVGGVGLEGMVGDGLVEDSPRSATAASREEQMAAHAQRIAVAVRDLKSQGATSAAVLGGYEQWHADVAGRVCGNQQELMSRMEAVEALAGKVYKRMNWTSSVVKSNLQHLRAGAGESRGGSRGSGRGGVQTDELDEQRCEEQLAAPESSYEGLCEELEAAGLEFDCEMEEIRRIDGHAAAEDDVEARESGGALASNGRVPAMQPWERESEPIETFLAALHHISPSVLAFPHPPQPLPVMVGFLQGNPVSHWSGGVNLWKPPAVKPGDILVFQWFAETHDVQRFKNIFAFKACAFLNAVPLTSASQFGMRLFQVKPAHAGKTLFFGSSVGKDCQRGVKIAIPQYPRAAASGTIMVATDALPPPLAPPLLDSHPNHLILIIARRATLENPLLLSQLNMATLRSVFILALVLASLPALYAAAAPKQRGDVTGGGSAAVDAAARWGRKLLEASSGAHVDHVGAAEEEEVGEATDGLDEAVRVLLSSEQMKKFKEILHKLKKNEQMVNKNEQMVNKNGRIKGNGQSVITEMIKKFQEMMKKKEQRKKKYPHKTVKAGGIAN
ncbi:unnamed protein product [Closterium sp. Naga37s-1]|nr:unnamed protein product [Closterium sp. Naga37s-1]